jgi:hypothetical protein
MFENIKHWKIYNTVAVPALFYVCETWVIREQDKSRITSAEVKFMRTAKYTQKDYKTNEDILSAFANNPVLKKIQDHRNKLIHVRLWTETDRLPYLITNYHRCVK